MSEILAELRRVFDGAVKDPDGYRIVYGYDSVEKNYLVAKRTIIHSFVVGYVPGFDGQPLAIRRLHLKHTRWQTDPSTGEHRLAIGFKRGTIATQMMGAWLGGHLQNWLAPNTRGLWRAADLPGGAYGSWGGTFYAIPKKSQNKEAAWEFIKYMTLNKDVQLAGSDSFTATLIDDKAILTDQDRKYVLIVNAENTVERRFVELGALQGTELLVRVDQLHGESVLVHPAAGDDLAVAGHGADVGEDRTHQLEAVAALGNPFPRVERRHRVGRLRRHGDRQRLARRLVIDGGRQAIERAQPANRTRLSPMLERVTAAMKMADPSA